MTENGSVSMQNGTMEEQNGYAGDGPVLLKEKLGASSSRYPHFATNAIHVGQSPDQWGHGQVVAPISLATTYKQPAPGKPTKYDYSRAGNPTRECLETCLAATEGAKYCSVFASGLAGVSVITNYLHTGDHIVCCDDVYGGSQRFFRTILIKHGITTTLVDMTDVQPVIDAIQPNTKVVWIESPTNPLMKVADIAGICDAVKALNRPELFTVVDNTFMSPYFQRPLSLGADIVIHSITKYINGHSDVTMGCTMTNSETLAKHFSFNQLAVGPNPSPFECFLVNRGVKTLAVRMERHMSNSIAVARFLEANERIERVLYPELPSHPQHALHKRQAIGMSGMMSFYLKGGIDEATVFLQTLKYFILAESLGGYESLAEIPAVMTHASVPKEHRDKLGITDNLIRLSVGIEDVDDLIADLDQALRAAVRRRPSPRQRRPLPF